VACRLIASGLCDESTSVTFQPGSSSISSLLATHLRRALLRRSQSGGRCGLFVRAQRIVHALGGQGRLMQTPCAKTNAENSVANTNLLSQVLASRSNARRRQGEKASTAVSGSWDGGFKNLCDVNRCDCLSTGGGILESRWTCQRWWVSAFAEIGVFKREHLAGPLQNIAVMSILDSTRLNGVADRTAVAVRAVHR
jgi:hypothetical protein